MRKILIILTLTFFIAPAVFSQAKDKSNVKPTEDPTATEKSKPVRNTFGTSTLIDNHTTATPYKGGLELEIQHRFSQIKNYHDLFGIYGAANTRLGLNYGITDRIMIGLGTTKDFKLQDLQWKVLLLQQTEDRSVPVSLSYYGNVVADLRKKDAFGPLGSFKEMHRFSYFTQLIIAEKLNDMFSLQLAPCLAYFNTVPYISSTTKYKNLNFGLSAGLRANLFGSHSLLVEFDKLLTKQDIPAPSKPNLSLGWEIGTATHSFQVFAANYSQIILQRNLVFNTNDFTKGEYLFGFNITVRF